jgi:hypothetical protein
MQPRAANTRECRAQGTLGEGLRPSHSTGAALPSLPHAAAEHRTGMPPMYRILATFDWACAGAGTVHVQGAVELNTMRSISGAAVTPAKLRGCRGVPDRPARSAMCKADVQPGRASQRRRSSEAGDACPVLHLCRWDPAAGTEVRRVRSLGILVCAAAASTRQCPRARISGDLPRQCRPRLAKAVGEWLVGRTTCGQSAQEQCSMASCTRVPRRAAPVASCPRWTAMQDATPTPRLGCFDAQQHFQRREPEVACAQHAGNSLLRASVARQRRLTGSAYDNKAAAAATRNVLPAPALPRLLTHENCGR